MHKRKILLVEDDHDFSQLMTVLLQSRDYDVTTVHSGEDALVQINHHPDLVLLDRSLPDMEGLDVCRKIREDNRLRGIPIVFISSRDTPADKVEGLYVGADDYIAKPFDREEFFARLDAVLRRNQLSGQAHEERKTIADELKRILETKSITPFFQPIFSLKTYKPLGYELLIRPPQDSILNNPEYLFKAALSFGLYFDLEMLGWSLAIKRWIEAKSESKLFLNCSPYMIESGQFHSDILSSQGVRLDHIVLELTERMAIQDYAVFCEKLNEFKKLGINFAVDDVGSGYASLDTVAEVSPNIVKIDMPLIRSIEDDNLKQNIVQAIVGFCKKSNILSIAEGIESRAELKKIIELGVDAAQGYLLARPHPEIHLTSIQDFFE